MSLIFQSLYHFWVNTVPTRMTCKIIEILQSIRQSIQWWSSTFLRLSLTTFTTLIASTCFVFFLLTITDNCLSIQFDYVLSSCSRPSYLCLIKLINSWMCFFRWTISFTEHLTVVNQANKKKKLQMQDRKTSHLQFNIKK